MCMCRLSKLKVADCRSQSFIFNNISITKCLHQYKKNSLAYIKSNDQAESFNGDMNKWLALHNIIKLNKRLDFDLARAFDKNALDALRCHFKTNLFGKPNRFSNALKLQLLNILGEYKDEGELRKLKANLSKIMSRESDAVSRVIEGLFVIPCKFDNQLFGEPHPLRGSRPDYAVEVDLDGSLINLVGEVKFFPCPRVSLALDAFRLGMFAMALIEMHNLKCIMLFQAKGK
ncbi:hypothetical protein A0J61_10984 [Choanephora cucurbitarum]|uniref:Uncharacterized protein n=1 Tax=Choanephora cucurbitarum TaxID=101091 RepID=A0A1C7MVZ4_9FUNG|nr:hypothetical protein A0J61_10984 [Choanephora cucurbitarum]